MNNRGIVRSQIDPYEVVADRCKSLGLAVWRCNPAGVIISEPQEEGLLGLWHNASPLSRVVAHAVCELSGMAPTEPIALDKSCWAIILPETWRNRLGGYLVALALGEGIFESDLFINACKSGQLDMAATRRCLRDRAIFNEIGVRNAMRIFSWMVQDLEAVGELDETVTGFTEQLGNAYETIDLLYSLGHSMNEPNEPSQFILSALENLHAAMDFSWIGAIFVDDPACAPVVHGQFFGTGQASMPQHQLERACRSLINTHASPSERKIHSDCPDFEPDGGPQVVVQPINSGGSLAGYLFAGEKRGVDPQVSSYDTHLLEATASYMGPFLENAALYETQNRMFLGTLRALTSAIDAKDPYTCGHSERVAHLSALLAREIGYEPERADRVHIAGLVHDVGKIGVPESILTKPGKLESLEFDSVREHPQIGYNILRDIPLLDDVLPGVLHHHERWDGKGYPHGLAGNDIPFLARLIGVADSFDAMSSNRAYRAASSREHVLEEIRSCAGTQFDPDLIEPFLALNFTEYDRMVAHAHAKSSAASVHRAA